MCRGIYKVHYFAPFQNCWNVREKRQRAIQGVREVVETASDKMSAAPELNPGDWKWIECISPYIDSCWHRGDSDREEERRERGELEWVNEWDERKGTPGREKKSSGVLPADHWSLSNPPPLPLYHYRDQGFCFHQAMQHFWESAKPAGCPRGASHHLAAPSTPGNGHNWKSQTNSWMTRARGHWVPRG